MSSPNPDVAVSTIYKYVNGPVKNNTLTKTPLLYWIKKKGTIKYGVGGTRYSPQAHIYQTISPSGWNGRNMGTFPDPVMFRSPLFDWTGYIVQYMTLEWDRLENRAGDTRRFDREKEILKATKKAWEPFFEAKFWLDNSTASPPGVVGLPGFMKATGTYGGLAQTEATFAPTIVNGATAIAGKTFATDPMALIRRAVNNHASKGGSSGIGITDKPSIAFMTQAIYEFLISYHVGKAFTPITVSTDSVGFNMLDVMECGVHFYWSPSATSAQIAFLNPEDMELVFQTDEMFVVRMSEPDQPIGEIVQIYNKFLFCCNNPYNQLLLSNTGVT